jgi:hypothetical protein
MRKIGRKFQSSKIPFRIDATVHGLVAQPQSEYHSQGLTHLDDSGEPELVLSIVKRGSNAVQTGAKKWSKKDSCCR